MVYGILRAAMDKYNTIRNVVMVSAVCAMTTVQNHMDHTALGRVAPVGEPSKSPHGANLAVRHNESLQAPSVSFPLARLRAAQQGALGLSYSHVHLTTLEGGSSAGATLHSPPSIVHICRASHQPVLAGRG